MSDKPRIANIKNPLIESAVSGLLRLENKEQALERLEQIKTRYILSRSQEEDQAVPSARLWIKGYNITEEEKKKGYLGNYVLITIEPSEDGKYTLKGEKQDIALNFHPQKKRQKQRHPNWGHPLLRELKKDILYATVDEPRDIFQKLHEEYPDITIPCHNKMYIMIYERKPEGGNPVQKYILEIELQKEGGFKIIHRKNDYQKQELPGMDKKSNDAPTTASGNEEPQEPKGYFTSMVEHKRKKK